MTDKKPEAPAWTEPAESPATFEKIKALLGADKITFDLTTHKPVLTCEEAATVRGVNLASGAKAMLIKDVGKKLVLEGVPYYLAVLSASTRFSSKAFKKLIKCKSIRFASPEEVFQTTGCLPGAVPPFGKFLSVPLWVDRSLGKNEKINFNCGLRTTSMSMSYSDWFKFEEPTWNVFTEEEIELGDLPKEEAKTEVKKDGREAKKAERLAARQNKVAAQGSEGQKDPNDPSAHLFGERPLMRSQGDPEIRHTKKFTDVKYIHAGMEGAEIIVRCRLHNCRAKGKLCFTVLRQQFSTIQAILAADETISKGMVNFVSKVPRESIIEVKAKVIVPDEPIETCTQKVELQILEFWIVNKSAPILPF